MAYSGGTRAAIGVAFVWSVACVGFDPFTCAQSTQCDRELGGVCMVGSCAYPDAACGSMLRYDENADMDLGGQCVEAVGTGGPTQGDDGGEDSTSTAGGTTLSADDVADNDATATQGPADTGAETGQPSCGAAGEPCCGVDSCDVGLSCLGEGCSCVASIAAGNRHTCAVKLDGTVHCWGANNSAQLGQMVIADSTVPLEVPGPFGPGMAASFLSARDHTCALRSDDVALCWGSNTLGQVDPASGVLAIADPTLASWGTGAVALGTGAGHTCVARDNGTSSTCWGDNASGQLTGVAPGPTPVDTTLGIEFQSVATGNDFSCGAQVTGAVRCWGSNAQGQLANDPALVPSSTAPVLAMLPNAAAIVAGGQHACAHIGTGVQCWGRGDSGQLGDGLGVGSFTPVTVALPPGATTAHLAAGPNHSCVLTTVGEVYCWGSNDNGQLMLEPDKNGNDQFTLSPVRIPLDTTAVQIATGATHTCVLASTGDVLCWGTNSEGQLGDGTKTYGFEATPVLLECP